MQMAEIRAGHSNEICQGCGCMKALGMPDVEERISKWRRELARWRGESATWKRKLQILKVP